MNKVEIVKSEFKPKRTQTQIITQLYCFFFCLSLFYQYVHLVKPGNNPHIKNVSIGLGQFQQLMRIKLFPPPYPVQRITKRAKNWRGKKRIFTKEYKKKKGF